MTDTQTEPLSPTTGLQITPDAELASLREENRELHRASQIQAAKGQLTAALAVLGAASPGLLSEAAAGDLQLDEAGEFTNSEALTASLRRKYPEQFASAAQGAPSIDAAAGRIATPRLTRELLARMKPAEIAKLDWNDVRRVLSS